MLNESRPNYRPRSLAGRLVNQAGDMQIVADGGAVINSIVSACARASNVSTFQQLRAIGGVVINFRCVPSSPAVEWGNETEIRSHHLAK